MNAGAVKIVGSDTIMKESKAGTEGAVSEQVDTPFDPRPQAIVQNAIPAGSERIDSLQLSIRTK